MLCKARLRLRPTCGLWQGCALQPRAAAKAGYLSHSLAQTSRKPCSQFFARKPCSHCFLIARAAFLWFPWNYFRSSTIGLTFEALEIQILVQKPTGFGYKNAYLLPRQSTITSCKSCPCTNLQGAALLVLAGGASASTRSREKFVLFYQKRSGLDLQ